MAEFEAGDVVRLKTGGPEMTVENVIQEPAMGEIVQATWFDEDNNKQSDSFSPEALVVVEED